MICTEYYLFRSCSKNIVTIFNIGTLNICQFIKTENYFLLDIYANLHQHEVYTIPANLKYQMKYGTDTFQEYFYISSHLKEQGKTCYSNYMDLPG